jgi:hypothetical protein
MTDGLRRAVSLASTLLLGTAGLALAILALRRAGLPYDEMGRFYDSATGIVYKDSAPLAYGLLAVLFLLAALPCAIWAVRSWRR